MANTDNLGLDFDPQYSHLQYNPRLSWPIHQNEATPSLGDGGMPKRATSPNPLRSDGPSLQQAAEYQASGLMRDWQLDAQPLATTFNLDTSFPQQRPFETYEIPFQTSPTEYMPSHPSLNASITNLDASLQMDGSYLPIQHFDRMPINWQDFQAELMGFTTANGLPDIAPSQHSFPEQSPVDTYLEARSLTSSSSNDGWPTIEYPTPHVGAIFNPGPTLHPRTFSDSSISDLDQYPRNSWDSYVEVPNAINSPGTDSLGDVDVNPQPNCVHEAERMSPVITTALVQPIAIRQPASPPQRSSPTSPSSRRQSRKNPSSAKPSKAVPRRLSQTTKDESMKRVGRRKGPLRPDQRKQASEIRKLGACLRCRFLKKTCDKGEPCGGCQPSHARLWIVPCTRIDIKDIAYFMKDFKADYERHMTLGVSISNIKGFSDHERTLWVTHGFGHLFPVRAREVYVRDDKCFGADWVETHNVKPLSQEVNTARLSAGMEGISNAMLSEYLDRYIDGGFENWVDQFFGGTPFITEILKTAYRFWCREKTPVIRKALKLVLAYNLTQHIILVEGVPEEEAFVGKVTDQSSKYKGKIVAPVMINFQVKAALADMWRQLQKDILEELSSLYSSVYTRDKLKHWPTIFLLASILLTVWEEMQFDCHYRVPDTAVVNKFCHDMETIPVGVIVGLFCAISQKLPSFSEWDSGKHHHQLNSNPAVCDAMTEVREHVTRHDQYLRSRANTSFDRDDFDSLSNKFVSKLVIRAN